MIARTRRFLLRAILRLPMVVLAGVVLRILLLLLLLERFRCVKVVLQLFHSQ